MHTPTGPSNQAPNLLSNRYFRSLLQAMVVAAVVMLLGQMAQLLAPGSSARVFILVGAAAFAGGLLHEFLVDTSKR